MRSIASIVILSVFVFSGACEYRYTVEPTVTLTVSPLGEGTISDEAGFFCSGANTCSEQFPPGTVLDLSATGDGGYDFRSWSGCDAVDDTTCNVTLDADRVVFPTFGKALARNPRAFILTSADVLALVAVAGPELNEEFTFGSGAPTIPQLVAGDRIASPFEMSFVRRVTSVTPAASGEIVLATDLATLEDVFDEGTLSFSGQLTSGGDGTLPPGLQMMGFDPAGTFTLQVEQEIADGVSIVGSIRQDFFLDVAVDYQWYSGLREVRAALKTEATNELILKIEGSASIDAKYEFPPIPLGEYLVNGVLLSPRIILEVGAKGSAESSMSAGVEYEIDTVTGFHYRRDADPQWEPISSLSQDLSPIWEPEPLAISVKGYAKAKLEVLVYKVAGPYFDVEGYTRAVVAPWNDPWWSVYAGFEAGVGLHAEVPVLGATVADWSTPVYKREWLLDAATPRPSATPPPTPSPTPAPTVSSVSPTAMTADGVSHTLTINGGNFQAGNQVQFYWAVGSGSGVWNNSGSTPSITSASQMTIAMNPGTVNDTIYARVCRSSMQTTASDCSSGTHSVTVTSTALPDLTGSAVVASSVSQGQTVQLPVTVYRSGGSLSGGTYVLARLYWSMDSTWDGSDVQLWESNGSTPDYPVSALNSNGSKTVNATIVIPAGSGTRYLIAVIDPPTASYPSSYYAESNENNNAASYFVTVP